MTPGDTRLSRIQAWFAAHKGWRAYAIAFAAGALAALGYAPLFFAPAYVAGVVVLVWLLDAAIAAPRRWRAFFARGWFWGVGHFAAGMYWIASPFMVDPQRWGLVWAIPCTLLFACGLALFFALGAALAAPVWTRDLRRLPAFAAALAVTEFLRGHVLTGLPWNLPAYIWEAGGPISQTASVVGVYGLSAITLLIAAAPAAVADGQASAGRRFAPVLLGGLILGLMWGAGAARLGRAPVSVPGELPIVRVADSGMSQAEKWKPESDQEWRVLARYLRATGAESESRAQVVIWPEGAIPSINFFVLENPAFLTALGRGLGDRALILGFTRRGLVNGRIAYYNSAAVIDGVAGAPRVAQIYDKHHLVPFGEYIPFWPAVSRAAQVLSAMGAHIEVGPLQEIGDGFAPGASPQRMIVPEAPPATVLICYEAIFPGMVPRGEERPGWIVNISNDAWFGAGAGPWQHFNSARYRTIEEGLPMARAASGGVSGIIDAMGRTVRITYHDTGFAEAQLPQALPPTLYAAWGAWLAPLLILVIAALRCAPALGRTEKEKHE
ncbi:MAG: apolipoprotein N-acyltransferase [Hyphomonadaceae bacterium]